MPKEVQELVKNKRLRFITAFLILGLYFVAQFTSQLTPIFRYLRIPWPIIESGGIVTLLILVMLNTYKKRQWVAPLIILVMIILSSPLVAIQYMIAGLTLFIYILA